MRKVLFGVVGILGFVLVFCVSGLIAYYLFPDDIGSGEPDNIYDDAEAMAPIHLTDNNPIPAADINTAELTIVTPSLDSAKTIVRRGTISDVVKNEVSEPTLEATETVYNEAEPDVQQNSADNNSAAEQPKASVNETVNVKETENNKQAENPPVKQEEPVKEAADSTPKTNPVQVSPNVQISDTGL